VRGKDFKWLEQIRDLTDASAGMYPGMETDRVPHSVALRLGVCIGYYTPHNPVHKCRYVINDEGRKALREKRGPTD
jgi:hypothetical protein